MVKSVKSEGLATLSEYATHRGVSPANITKFKKAGRLVMDGNRVDIAATDAKLDSEFDLRGGDQTEEGGGVSRADYLAVKTRDTHWSAEQKRLKALREAGSLVEAEAVRREAFAQARLIQDALMNLPDRLAAPLAAETDPVVIHKTLTTELITVCNHLADGHPDRI